MQGRVSNWGFVWEIEGLVLRDLDFYWLLSGRGGDAGVGWFCIGCEIGGPRGMNLLDLGRSELD